MDVPPSAQPTSGGPGVPRSTGQGAPGSLASGRENYPWKRGGVDVAQDEIPGSTGGSPHLVVKLDTR